MLQELENFITSLDFSDIDKIRNFKDSYYFKTFLKLFPNLRGIFHQGLAQDSDEFNRTFGHILRILRLYFGLKKSELDYENIKLFHALRSESLQTIKKKIEIQAKNNALLLPLILIFHDLGRFYDKKTHPEKSFNLMKENSLLDTFSLTNFEKSLVLKTIQNHLLVATIFTGESTFYSSYSLLNDKEFLSFIDKRDYLERFLNLLEIFTYLDIMGYSYSRIYDHYISYYQKIIQNLKKILSKYTNHEKALKLAKKYSQKYLEWRLAGALRIFQFIGTEPHLTKRFYYKKLKESIKGYNVPIFKNGNWKKIREDLLPSYKIQIKYGLGVLMLFAFGKFFRKGMEKSSKVSNSLLFFWLLLSKKIKKLSKGNPSFLWNVSFKGIPNWSTYNRRSELLIKMEEISEIIENSTLNLDENTKEYHLSVNVDKIFI
ncbi:MAG: hypothetical protein BAJALOKI2v1_130012 [Promethearchaeota archaeon]|nr:MAG: hypothetical protein BAJALOKI2v1_130012 [Candidatus Lokiarchaeota archaeon]